jgi:hypothetical protein
VGRTFGNLIAIDPSLPTSQRGKWEDVTGRAMMSSMLITDTTGRLDMMVSDTTGAQFTDEIKQAAEQMQ